ncbi:hypothetical protein BT93_B1146 [Corymbia citriodora subsp. variegata]|nr:hypothetical protein BT93_B1146 [Corymbia citriodora subsp. variegata]
MGREASGDPPKPSSRADKESSTQEITTKSNKRQRSPDRKSKTKKAKLASLDEDVEEVPVPIRDLLGNAAGAGVKSKVLRYKVKSSSGETKGALQIHCELLPPPAKMVGEPVADYPAASAPPASNPAAAHRPPTGAAPPPGPYPPSAYPPVAYHPSWYPPPGYHMSGYPPAGYPPNSLPPPGYLPNPALPHGYPPPANIYAPPGYWPAAPQPDARRDFLARLLGGALGNVLSSGLDSVYNAGSSDWFPSDT